MSYYDETDYAIASLENEQKDNGTKPQLCDGWRDVRKALPSPRQRVIVTDGTIVTMAWISAKVKDRWEGWTILDNEYFGEVVAWRELPHPPPFA